MELCLLSGKYSYGYIIMIYERKEMNLSLTMYYKTNRELKESWNVISTRVKSNLSLSVLLYAIWNIA